MTGVGLNNGYLSDEWYIQRQKIFKEFTLKSLENQTIKNFIVWMTFREEEKSNPLTENLRIILEKSKVNYIFTFHNLMYWDDKFNTDFASRILNTLRCIRDFYRKRKITLTALRQIYYNKNKNLKERLSKALEEIQKKFNNKNHRDILITRIDSDDIFHKKALEEIRNSAIKSKKYQAFVFKNGYIYNSKTGELAEYHPKTNPPFYTLKFPKNVFFNAEKHIQFYNGFKSHEDITRIFRYKVLTDFRYCVVIHNPKNHISTIWNHPFRGKIIQKNKKKILKNFAVC